MQSTGNPATGKASDAPIAARIIKRYANRKLYDTRDSRYVTLQQIGEFVRDGQDVKIIDNTSKEDLTSATLAQIVYEAEKNNPETAKAGTMGTLRDLIQNSGEKLISTLREGPMGKLIARREEGAPLEKPVPVEKPAAVALDPQRKNLLMHPKDAIDELQRLADERVNVVLGTAIQSVHQLQNEVRRLQGRIEELETKLVAVQQRRGQAGDDVGREKEPEPSER